MFKIILKNQGNANWTKGENVRSDVQMKSGDVRVMVYLSF